MGAHTQTSWGWEKGRKESLMSNYISRCAIKYNFPRRSRSKSMKVCKNFKKKQNKPMPKSISLRPYSTRYPMMSLPPVIAGGSASRMIMFVDRSLTLTRGALGTAGTEQNNRGEMNRPFKE